MKSPGATRSRSSQLTGNDTGTPGRIRGENSVYVRLNTMVVAMEGGELLRLIEGGRRARGEA